MKHFPYIFFAVALLLAACKHEPTGPDNPGPTGNKFNGCWLLGWESVLSDSGWNETHENNINNDTLYFTDSTYINLKTTYSYNAWAEEWEWSEVGIDFGKYHFTDDSLYFQYQSNLAEYIPQLYEISDDSLFFDWSLTKRHYYKSNCSVDKSLL